MLSTGPMLMEMSERKVAAASSGALVLRLFKMLESALIFL